MKKRAIQFVAIFEIVIGISGLIWVVFGLTGVMPFGVASALWYGIFPIISIGVGILLWRNWRTALTLSYAVLLLQAIVIHSTKFSLNLAVPINLTVNGIWNARAGRDATVIGINFVALVVMAVLMYCQSEFQGLPLWMALERKSAKPTELDSHSVKIRD